MSTANHDRLFPDRPGHLLVFGVCERAAWQPKSLCLRGRRNARGAHRARDRTAHSRGAHGSKPRPNRMSAPPDPVLGMSQIDITLQRFLEKGTTS
ncbi:hypothetical protein AAFF_G00173590 [Aldrovandia affinis]|uniref:Uncharacterized protein n=1 Tax=Aldrovandia affinis TaxID=143900 RepID=A0AAD7SZ41_9TELE|nr:hypothetical protein AAFF_G00173590 [Aldrovandia affinis]